MTLTNQKRIRIAIALLTFLVIAIVIGIVLCVNRVVTTQNGQQSVQNPPSISSGSYDEVKYADRISPQRLAELKSNNKRHYGNKLTDDMMEQFRTSQDEYTINLSNVLGSGGFGTVYEGFGSDGKRYAIKVENLMSTNIQTEAFITTHFNHSHLLSGKDYHVENGLSYLCLEYLNGKTLTQYDVEIFTEEQIREMARQLVSAVGYMHAHNFAHMDLKPGNIMIEMKEDKPHLTLFDFGISLPFSSATPNPTISFLTERYAPPEVLSNSVIYPDLSDAWSLGTVIHYMYTGNYTFPRINGAVSQLHAIESQNYEAPKRASSQGISFLRSLLNKKPFDRRRVLSLADDPYLTKSGSLRPVDFHVLKPVNVDELKVRSWRDGFSEQLGLKRDDLLKAPFYSNIKDSYSDSYAASYTKAGKRSSTDPAPFNTVLEALYFLFTRNSK